MTAYRRHRVLFQAQFSSLNICNDFYSVSVSGMSGDGSVDHMVVVRFFSRKSLSYSILRLKSCSTRFCALLLKLLNSSNQQIVTILLVNAYLPTNYGSDESTTTFRETIAELEGFLLTQMYDYVIIAGDFNVDFAKVSPIIALSLSTLCKPLTSLGVIYALISHSHTDVTITSFIPGLIMLFVLQAPSVTYYQLILLTTFLTTFQCFSLWIALLFWCILDLFRLVSELSFWSPIY